MSRDDVAVVVRHYVEIETPEILPLQQVNHRAKIQYYF